MKVSAAKQNAEVFTFGVPESVIDRRAFLLLLEVGVSDQYYVTPISMIALGNAHRVSAYHASAMALKRDLLMQCFRPNG